MLLHSRPFSSASLSRLSRWAGSLFAAILVGCSHGGHQDEVAVVTPPPPPVVVADPTLLLSSVDGGASLLGAINELPLESSAAATAYAKFEGTAWIHGIKSSGHGLVFNSADNKFYAVLNGAGADKLGMLISFDPATDKLTLLKSLPRRSYPKVTGINAETFEFEAPNGFFRRPLLSPDGKAMLLRSSYGGVDDRGALIHINLDTKSADYLSDSLVYSFFDYEKSRGNYCDSLRNNGDDQISEMVWGLDPAGKAVVYMAVQGVAYDVSLASNPTEPRNCNLATIDGKTIDKIMGRMFALKPGDASDLAKPWSYSHGYSTFDPLLHLGRQLYWDSRQKAVRWTTESVGGGMLDFYAGGDGGPRLYFGATEQCFRLQGLLPLNLGGDSIAMCSGLNGSDTVPDSPPRIFHYTANGFFTQHAMLNNFYPERKFINGATSSLASRRVFINGGDLSSDCSESVTVPCLADSTLEELDPVTGYFQQILAKGDMTSSGRLFLGDPAVGAAMTEPMADRYVVWFGAMVKGYSAVLNKYDRSTGKTTSLPLDPKTGAHPLGPLLDLGNGQAIARVLAAAPAPNPRADKAYEGVGGYAGGPGMLASQQGYAWFDLKTKQMLRSVSQDRAIKAFSQERVKLDDGSLWEAIVYNLNDGFGDCRAFNKIDASSGKLLPLKAERCDDTSFPSDPFALAGRGSTALYLPFWKANVDAAKGYADATLACMRVDSPAAFIRSDALGPAQAGFGNAHRIVYGASYSPANKAMYLATAKLADADQGTIFEVDKGVADADLCKAKPVITPLVSGLSDVPSTRIFSLKSGVLAYGTSNGKLMKLDPAAKSVALLADLRTANAASSVVRGYLAEAKENVLALLVFDYDAGGRNTARRLVTVDVLTAKQSSRDVTQLISESEPYPGVMRLN
ncbi:hypothetical protein PRZ03_13530 [Paucibacter sp. hw8]|uniref:Uncharacterized protein n=2 Tax=Roseateles albus TaxID=2987525 RepID=A0ABT5KF97_9BURK|nr:hypothetical protein [Roseateles albus]